MSGIKAQSTPIPYRWTEYEIPDEECRKDMEEVVGYKISGGVLRLSDDHTPYAVKHEVIVCQMAGYLRRAFGRTAGGE